VREIKAIVNGKLIMRDRIMQDSVIIFDKKIIDIMSKDSFSQYKRENKEDIQVIDAKNRYVSPGFIDIHIHGSGGYDTMDAMPEALKVISSTIAGNGVSAYLPTTMTMDRESIYKAFDAIREAMQL